MTEEEVEKQRKDRRKTRGLPQGPGEDEDMETPMRAGQVVSIVSDSVLQLTRTVHVSTGVYESALRSHSGTLGDCTPVAWTSATHPARLHSQRPFHCRGT